jgi:hypothetical protein
MGEKPAITEDPAMTRPSPTLSRYLLATAAPPRHRDPNAAKVRRYRLARVQNAGRTGTPDRFAHLRRSYD